jgi:hypothetical protein
MVVTIGGTVNTPTLLLALGLTLRPEHDADRRGHMAHLAGRLGYASVWLPEPLAPAELTALAEQAAPARVGVVLDNADGLGALPPDVLVELDPAGTDRKALAALAARPGWYTRTTDPDATGWVVDQAALPAAATARAGTSKTITVAGTVSIGRTTSEAAARAARDPALAGGRPLLFGTLEHAQEQAMALRRAGADALRVVLPDEEDFADLLAQLRAAVAGPTPLLHARGGR